MARALFESALSDLNADFFLPFKIQATWLEGAADYKSYLEQWQKNPDHKQMNKLTKYYERLKK